MHSIQDVSANLLTVKNLSVEIKYAERIKRVVDDLSFSMRRGETLGIVGESGSGKSMAAQAMLRLMPPGIQHRIEGNVFFNQIPLLTIDKPQLRDIRGADIGMIFQDPLNALNPLQNVGQQIRETLIIHKGMSKQEAYDRSYELLIATGIRHPKKRLEQYPHELSGGQCQRIMIAMAIANRPQLLIADEPTTALDVTIQAQIMDLLEKLKDELNMGMILISHDLHLMHRHADHVIVMKDGKAVEIGERDQIFHSPQKDYTKALVAAENLGVPSQITAHDGNILEAKDIKVRFPIKKSFWGHASEFLNAVDEISFEIPRGSTLGVVGESGSGKTTIGMALLQLVKHQGTFIFNQENLSTLKRDALRKMRSKIQIVFQNPFASLSPRLSVEAIIREGLDLHFSHLSREEKHDRMIDSLAAVGLEQDVLFHYPHEFSGGQRQRIAIARALVLEPQLIILDEPTSALDRLVQKQVIELLKDLQTKKQLSYLFISHDLSVIRAMSHHVLVISQGKIIESGTTQKIFETPENNYTKTLIEAADH